MNPYEPKTDDELRTLAAAIFAGEIFHIYNIDKDEAPETMLKVFWPLEIAYMKDGMAAFDYIQQYNLDMIYAYWKDKAGLGVAGKHHDYPCFFSINYLSGAEAKRCNEFYKTLSGGKSFATVLDQPNGG